MPLARFLRILNSVVAAPTSIPPTAMGRTMNFQTAMTWAAQNASSVLTPLAAAWALI